MMNEKGLLDLKEAIEKATTAVAEMKGKLDHLKSELKSKWNCETLEEAEAILDNLHKEEKEMQETIDEKLEKIEKAYYDEME